MGKWYPFRSTPCHPQLHGLRLARSLCLTAVAWGAPLKDARGSSVPCPHFLQELGTMSLKTVFLMPNVCIKEQKIVTNMHEFTDMAFGPSFLKYVLILFIDLAVLGPSCGMQDF